jgi:L-lactate dehydrogenase
MPPPWTEMTLRTAVPHISIIGAGNVGSATMNALAASTVPLRLVLLNRTREKAEGHCWDAEDALALWADHEMIATDDYAHVAGSDVVIVTAGSRNLPGESRLALTGRNAATSASIVERLDEVAPDAVIIMVTNPVDVLSRIAIENSRRDERLVFGSGTLLDTVRLRLQIARMLGVALADVDAMVVGEHGRTAVPVWSRATVRGTPIFDCTTAAQRDACIAAALGRYDAILTRKGCTNTAIAACLATIVASIVADDGATYPVSVRPHDSYGISRSVALGLPCSIGRNGVREQHVLALTDEERFALGLSAATLITGYESVLGDGQMVAVV